MEGGGHREEQKHACKLCRKSFPCGRSLGGHMRSHVSANSPPPAEADAKPALQPRPALQIPSGEWVSGLHGGGGRGARYVLRENPKKTWRLHDSIGGEISPERGKLCRECGKGFPSWRALFGHMRCHPVRPSRALGRQGDREQAEEAGEQEEEVDDDEGEEYGHGSLDSGAEKQLGLGVAMPRKVGMRARSKRGPAAMAIAADPSLPASKIQRELEDVALCLMMLSRDVGYWGDFHSIAKSSDADSAVLEEVEASTAREELRVCVPDGKNEKNKNKNKNRNGPCVVELENSDDGELGRDSAKKPRLRRALAELEKTNSELGRCNLIKSGKSYAYKHKLGVGRDRGSACDGSSAKPPHRKSWFECTTCGKTFTSYQALGGHKTSHRRARSYPAPKADGGENSVETSISVAAEEEELIHQEMGVAEEAISGSLKNGNDHECAICLKVFPSGRALGGHKRCHFSNATGGAGAACHPPAIVIQEQLSVVPGVLDLNLPAAAAAAAEEEDSNAGGGQVGFRPWWVGSDHQGEPLARLISS